MKSERLSIEILEYWHAGTGASGGPRRSSVVARSPGGLPYLPGRSLRGLVREGVLQAEEAGLVEEGTTVRLFGDETTEGVLRFTSATLGPDWELWAEEVKAADLEDFFDQVSGTRIDSATGQMAQKSLRTQEVAIPLSLSATVYLLDDEVFATEAIGAGLPLIRALGSHRRRGLGRAVFHLEELRA